jgi:DNA processing protein
MPDDTIKEITFSDYPVMLQNMKSPPKKLWMRGRWPNSKDQRFLCVIGSRANSSYGRQAVRKLIGGLCGYPISIVSGLAIGIDSLAHEAALETGLHCVGFPGSGLDWDILYPPSRQGLARRIVDAGGALLSEWEPTFPFTSWTFAARNRLMAGLAQATLIIEGKKGSGTLKTAEYAENYDRDVLVVPGSIFSDLSYGPHMLYKRGAIPIFESNDILEALGFVPAQSGAISEERFMSLNNVSQKVVNFIRRGETSSDLLIDELKISPSALSILLASLEIEGVIRIDGTSLYLA